jgi:hypothetical protein
VSHVVFPEQSQVRNFDFQIGAHRTGASSIFTVAGTARLDIKLSASVEFPCAHRVADRQKEKY